LSASSASKQTSSKVLGASKEGMLLTIDALRKVPGLKKSAKKELPNLGLFCSESSGTDSCDTTESSSSSEEDSHSATSLTQKKSIVWVKNKKHKT
jgi:hypothetical protein